MILSGRGSMQAKGLYDRNIFNEYRGWKTTDWLMTSSTGGSAGFYSHIFYPATNSWGSLSVSKTNYGIPYPYISVNGDGSQVLLAAQGEWNSYSVLMYNQTGASPYSYQYNLGTFGFTAPSGHPIPFQYSTRTDKSVKAVVATSSSGGGDWTLKTLDQNLSVLGSVNYGSQRPLWLAFSQDGNFVYSGSYSTGLRTYEIIGSSIGLANSRTAEYDSFQWGSTNKFGTKKLLVGVSTAGQCYLYELISGIPSLLGGDAFASSVTNAEISPDGRFVAIRRSGPAAYGSNVYFEMYEINSNNSVTRHSNSEAISNNIYATLGTTTNFSWSHDSYRLFFSVGSHLGCVKRTGASSFDTSSIYPYYNAQPNIITPRGMRVITPYA